MQHLYLITLLSIIVQATSLTWKSVPGATHASGIFAGIAALSPTRAVLAGGLNSIGEGVFLLDTTNVKNPLNQTMAITVCKLCMMTAVKFHPDGKRGIAGGEAMLGEPVTYSTLDGGESWTPSSVIAKGFNGALGGSDIELVPSSNEADDKLTWAFVTEFNSWSNGTVCNRNHFHPTSSQCSGLSMTTDMGNTYTNLDWMGTDGPDTDAAVASFPAANAWYVGGGLVQPESEQGAQWKAIVMKSVDEGKTFQTVLNITSPSTNPGKGIGSLLDIACSTADICYVTSSCFDPNCGDRYGSFVYKTINGGQSWKELGFFYESQMNVIRFLGQNEVVIGGGGVGLFDSAVVWYSTDGGATFTNTTLKGGPGLVMDLDFTSDGSGGFLTSVSEVSSTTTIYQMIK